MDFKRNNRMGVISLFAACVLFSLLNIFPGWKGDLYRPNQILMLILIIAFLIFYLIVFSRNKDFTYRDFIFLAFSFGFILRLVYCFETDFYVRQHDLDVGYDTGHFAYIMRMFNIEGLPEVNVENSWQFYQPPVWHVICALFLRIQTILGVKLEIAFENLQMISLFCSSSIMLLSLRLFKMFSLSKKSLCIAFSIVAFHPTFIILSGSINNDVLALTISLVSVILALRWYRRPSFKRIIFLALSIGFSMAVKLSAGLISLGVATLFAIKLFGKEYKNKLNLILQFTSFGVICVPLALWWQIRNLILFDVPITFVPMLKDTNPQYVGNYSVLERLFDFSSISNGVYPARITKAQLFDYFDYNIPLTSLKTSVFGEYYLGHGSKALSPFANLLFACAVLITVFAIIGAVLTLISMKKWKNSCNFGQDEFIFTIICALTLVISHVKFCFEFAHFCTMDFRYIALCIVFGALYVGLLVKESKKYNKIFGKITLYALSVTVGVFIVSSFAIYGTIA